MSTKFWGTAICGPSGGLGGEPFQDDVAPAECRVIAVRVYAGDQVYGVQIIHETCDGLEYAFPLHGHATGDYQRYGLVCQRNSSRSAILLIQV